MNKQNMTYIGNYPIQEDRPLIRSIPLKVPGIGFRNVYLILEKLDVPPELYRVISYSDLTQNQKHNLGKMIEGGIIETRSNYANSKKRSTDPLFKEQLSYDVSKDMVLCSETFGSICHVNVKRLTKLKCNIGLRHKVGRKVHGQRTKSTGRKNKILKGFQRKKKQKQKI